MTTRFDRYERNRKVSLLLCAVATLLLTILVIFSLYRTQTFEAQCLEYIEQSAKAGTPEVAIEHLGSALEYIEKHNLSQGTTAVLWPGPSDSLDLWHRHLAIVLMKLQDVPKDASLNDTTETLRRVQDILVTPQGRAVAPAGISVYPYNKEIAGIACFSLLLLIGGGLSAAYWWWKERNG